jgi:hypothetical protein
MLHARNTSFKGVNEHEEGKQSRVHLVSANLQLGGASQILEIEEEQQKPMVMVAQNMRPIRLNQR